jgi:HEAT repeat protein
MSPTAEPRPKRRWKSFLLTVLGLAALVVAGVWQRTALQVRYYAYRLEHAGEDERPGWAERLAEVGEPAAGALIDCLRRDDLAAAGRVGLQRWAADSPDRHEPLLRRVADDFGSFSSLGQAEAVALAEALLDGGGPPLAEVARSLVREALREDSPGARVQGVRLALRPDVGLLSEVVPLLGDPAAEVRRAALLALGPTDLAGAGAPSPVGADELLRWLHDPDPEVRRLCAMALKSRGLSDRDVRLGRRLTHPDAAERLRMLLELPQEDDVDLGVWLERLSNDPAAAVRAGAARVAAERGVEFADRLEQMSRSDPDPAVRRIADYYRRQPAR